MLSSSCTQTQVFWPCPPPPCQPRQLGYLHYMWHFSGWIQCQPLTASAGDTGPFTELHWGTVRYSYIQWYTDCITVIYSDEQWYTVMNSDIYIYRGQRLMQCSVTPAGHWKSDRENKWQIEGNTLPRPFPCGCATEHNYDTLSVGQDGGRHVPPSCETEAKFCMERQGQENTLWGWLGYSSLLLTECLYALMIGPMYSFIKKK